jgi:hypothetical protein
MNMVFITDMMAVAPAMFDKDRATNSQKPSAARRVPSSVRRKSAHRPPTSAAVNPAIQYEMIAYMSTSAHT